MHIKWAFLYDCGNKYIISDSGHVLNVLTGKIIKSMVSTSGYKCVKINKTTKYIHRLLAQSFIPNNSNFPQVNHKDGNKLNNILSNLEWCTERSNIDHYYKTKGRRGVTYRSDKDRYFANITVNNKCIYIGSFKNKEDAYEAFYNSYKNIKGCAPW